MSVNDSVPGLDGSYIHSSLSFLSIIKPWYLFVNETRESILIYVPLLLYRCSRLHAGSFDNNSRAVVDVRLLENFILWILLDENKRLEPRLCGFLNLYTIGTVRYADVVIWSLCLKVLSSHIFQAALM